MYPNPSSSAGDNFNRAKYPSRYPTISDPSAFETLCQSVDNEYIAHPTDCKRYAYCANGKKRDISSVRFFFLSNKRRVDIESIDQMHILSCLVYIRTINLDSSKLREEKLHVVCLLRESNENEKEKSLVDLSIVLCS
jgi:hypothetical protein